jgi:hypothetical protein
LESFWGKTSFELESISGCASLETVNDFSRGASIDVAALAASSLGNVTWNTGKIRPKPQITERAVKGHLNANPGCRLRLMGAQYVYPMPDWVGINRGVSIWTHWAFLGLRKR